jgi:transcriptional regulator with XRE-family HTH domain
MVVREQNPGDPRRIQRQGLKTMQELAIISTVAENVRRVRKAAGLSQEELALSAEVDRTYISQVERGKRNITVVVLDRLARAMRTTAAELVSDGRRIADEARAHGNRLGIFNALNHYWVFPCMYGMYLRTWGDEWLVLKSFL